LVSICCRSSSSLSRAVRRSNRIGLSLHLFGVLNNLARLEGYGRCSCICDFLCLCCGSLCLSLRLLVGSGRDGGLSSG